MNNVGTTCTDPPSDKWRSGKGQAARSVHLFLEEASMQRPYLADIAEQIRNQVCLLQGDSALTDLATVQARLEAIRQFAAQGLNFLEERARSRPKFDGTSSVE